MKPKKPQAGKAKKIKLKLTKKQRETLNKWFGTARWTYNKILAAIKQGEVAYNDEKEIRKRFINQPNYIGTENAWVLETPYDIRNEAMRDLVKAYKTNFAKRKINPEHTFEIKMKSKKAASDSIVIHDSHYNDFGVIYPDTLKKAGVSPYLHGYEKLPEKLIYDSRLQRTRWGEFYLCVLSPLDAPYPDSSYETQGLDQNVIALDPGVRTFVTGYDPDGRIMECGKSDVGRIYRLCNAFDRLQSRWSSDRVWHRKRYKMRRAGARIQKKIRNLVDELHKKLVKWLVINFRVVLLPKFETQRMVSRRFGRRIRSKTARAMLTWSHYRFQQRLLQKTREFTRCNVIICDEAYTSKTCGSCGCLHDKLGGSKVFHCPSCHVKLDRDVNGARNILLRYLTLHR